MNAMLDAFKMKPFDLEPVLAEWTDGPVFKGKPKKDLPVEEWLEKIKEGCVERKVPEEYWYKVAQHFMGPKAKARFEEVKKVIGTVNGGKYRWTWKKFKVAMTNMGWDIDPNATETVKVRAGSWFSRKKSDEDKEPEKKASTSEEAPVRKPPTRSNTLRWTKKPLVEEPIEEIFTPAAPRPKPSRSKTIAVTETSASSSSSFWSRKESKDDSNDAPKEEKEKKLTRPATQKAKSETMVSRPRSSSKSNTEVSRSHTSDSSGKEVSPVVTGNAPVWLLNAVGALDFLTSEHPKAVSVVSAILITVGSIPAIPAISAGAGGAVLASGAAHAIGAIAVGLGQALGASAMKNSKKEEGSHS